MHDVRSPVPGLEPKHYHEWSERQPLCHNHMLTADRHLIILIDNNDSRLFRPVAIMIVGKIRINGSGSFRISRQYLGNNLYGLRSEIIDSPPATNNSLKRNPLFFIKLPWIEWSL